MSHHRAGDEKCPIRSSPAGQTNSHLNTTADSRTGTKHVSIARQHSLTHSPSLTHTTRARPYVGWPGGKTRKLFGWALLCGSNGLWSQ